MAKPVRVNENLQKIIKESRMTYDRLALELGIVAGRNGDPARPGKSLISHWVRYSVVPSGDMPHYLAAVLSDRIGRTVTLADLGLAEAAVDLRDWRLDTLSVLADLRRIDVDDVEVDRSTALQLMAYSLGALALPGEKWWSATARTGATRGGASSRRVGEADVEAVRDMTSLFSQVDQRRGGGHARAAVVQYLTSDVARFLRGTFASDRTRRQMFSAAAELAYVAGWMAFDSTDHAAAQTYFGLAVRLAAEADDPAMAGHVLRAMAHQALDLGHPKQALDIATASISGDRYALACPRERALLGVIHARGLAATGQHTAASGALLQAQRDLAAAGPGDDEPARVFFFGEASLAHETASALRDIGDLRGAVKEFEHSVETRKASSFARTHAVTLGYLGAVHVRLKNIEAGCTVWSAALDAMEPVRSGRTRQTAMHMRATLSPFRHRGIRSIDRVDSRAAAYLEATS
ncbi:Tat pathway signal protein [Kitasatospora sp. NPDC059673]|uniref:Tat pathway signal protein n=1 Tax=Kitasatospora sp. NPDC059673 TaxID=3346901 RepID=UPI0036877664